MKKSNYFDAFQQENYLYDAPSALCFSGFSVEATSPLGSIHKGRPTNLGVWGYVKSICYMENTWKTSKKGV